MTTSSQPQNPQRVTARIFKLLKTRKREVFFIVGLIVLSSLFDLAVPFISQRLIDTLVSFFKNGGGAPMRVLALSVLGILVATIATRGLKSTYDYRLFKITTSLEDATKYHVIEKYLRLHTLFHHGVSSGQIIGRIERGATALYVIIHDIFGQSLLPPIIIVTAVLTATLFKSPIVALVMFLPLPVYLLIVRRFASRIYEIERKANDAFENVAKEAYDVASNVHTVKKFSQEQAETAHQVALQRDAREIQYGAERLWAIIENLQTLMATLGRIGVILVAGILVLKAKSTVGEFVLYITLQNMAYTPLSQLSVVFPRLRRNSARAERLFGILDEQIHVMDKPDATALPQLSSAIEFRDVWFRYGENKDWALRNVTLTIPAKTTVALVGRSGSGKTTFINLLLRSFDPQQGALFVDGNDLRDVTQESLRNQIAVVPQDVDLFSRTIRENIAYGRPNTPQEAIERAAKTALAHDFILKLDQGYDTVVGERGIKLSGGEKQRIGIARAVLRDPRILILDEATSQLDTESEQLIKKATDALIKNRTSFIIAHRLSTVLHADRILVFKNGAIEADGTHEKLLKTSPTYQRLHALQFSDA